MTSNAAEVANLMALARIRVDPAIKEEFIPLGEELLRVEKEYTPKGKDHRGRGKTLADSEYLKVRALSIQTVTNKRYARIIDEGGRTGAHEILPKSKDALAFGGVVVKSVHHPGSHYRASRFAERALETMEPVIVEGISTALYKSINGTLA